MSAKTSAAVAERRLRPLWEAIDSQQYKNALKLATNLLSKQPNSAYLMVLKALVLERMGKPDEALPLCEQASESEHVDDLTLSTLQIVFQRLNCLNKATLCYERACSKNVNNMELMLGLFNCYVREYSYLKQQQLAMKMYKLFGEERFLLWAVCSIQLQVSCGSGDKSLLLLAEALLKKRLDTNGFEELEALLVYLFLLQSNQKFEGALDVLSSKSGGLFSILTDKRKLEGKLLLQSHQYARAAEVFQEVLKESSDDWAVLLLFLDAILEVPEFAFLTSSTEGSVGMVSLPKEEVEQRLLKASELMQELQSQNHSELRRGPFLGTVEIERRRFLLQLGEESDIGHEPIRLRHSILQYFKRFGHMVSFASDIQEYLELIQKYGCGNLVELLYDGFNEVRTEAPLRTLRQRISLYQVELQLGVRAKASDNDLAVCAVDVVRLYIDCLSLSKDLDPQENVHGEELITIATTFLMELFLRTKHPGYVIEAILLLEVALTVRRHSFHFKILLTNLYSTIGCVSTALEWFKKMDVKNILLETMMHHILPSLTKGSTLWLELEALLKDTTKFYDDYFKEAADLVILAYRHRNYTKVLEFVQFKEKLQHSHNLLVVKAENRILQLKRKADDLDGFLRMSEELGYGLDGLSWAADENLGAVSFNEALETRPWWSPLPGESFLLGRTNKPVTWQYVETETQRLHRQKVWRSTLERRCLLPRLVILSMGAVRILKDGETGIQSNPEELRSLAERFGKTLGLSWEGMDDVLIAVLSSKSQVKDLEVEATDFFSLALFWTAYQMASHPFDMALLKDPSLKCPDLMNSLAKMFIDELINTFKSLDTSRASFSYCNTVYSWSSLPSLFCLITEAFTWYSLCLQMWHRALQPSAKLGKKKKKGSVLIAKADSAVDSDQSGLTESIKSSTDMFCAHLEALISLLTSMLQIPEANEVELQLELLEKGRHSDLEAATGIVARPGMVINLVESCYNMSDELGQGTGFTPRSWKADNFLRNIVSSQRAMLYAIKDLLVVRVQALRGTSQVSTTKTL